MNVILNEIKSIMEQNKEQPLPQVKSCDLEENGAVYFMNSKDGTEFERCLFMTMPERICAKKYTLVLSVERKNYWIWLCF